MRRQRAGRDQPAIESGPGDDPLSARNGKKSSHGDLQTSKALSREFPQRRWLSFRPGFRLFCRGTRSSVEWERVSFARRRSAWRTIRRTRTARPIKGTPSRSIADAHLAKGVAGAEPPPEEQCAEGREARPGGGGPLLDLGDGAPRRAGDGGQAQLQDAAEAQSEGRLRLPELRLARSRRRAQDGRVLRERRQGGRRGGDDARASRRSSSRSIRSPSCSRRRDIWLDEQGRLTHPMVRRAGRRPLRADLLGRRLRARSPTSCNALASPDEAVVLHLGPRQQRGGVSLRPLRRASSAPTTCPTARTCATSRAALGLTETIGIGKATVKIEDFELRRRDLRHRPEPGHQPSAHADRAAEGGAQRLQDRQRQSAARDRD